MDLYLRHKPTSEKDQHVVNLSRLLRALPIHPREVRTSTFRNATGVFMKLGNLRHIDPAYHGKGLGRSNRMAAVVWSEFGGDAERVLLAAAAIRKAARLSHFRQRLGVEQEGEQHAPEGRILFRLHRIRERKPRLVTAKKRQATRDNGKLVCEMCGFDPVAYYGPQGEAAIECHHIIPLAQLLPENPTRLSDLALVCASCHRVLHRLADVRSIPRFATPR